MNRVPASIAYLDRAAATTVGRDYKQRLLAGLDLHPGQAVLDVGCGPGTDLARLADAVTPGGSVTGVDHDAAMVAEAERRLAGRRHVRVLEGDAHALPLPDRSVDRAVVDRALQWLADPATAIGEVARVLRPGGVFGMGEPDWDTLAVADEDRATSRTFAHYLAGRVRNPTIGRDLVRLASANGFQILSVEAVPVVFRDFATADDILGLRRNSTRAVQAGLLDPAQVQPWLDRLETGPLLAGFTFYLVTARF